MANETGWMNMDWLETWWWVRQDVNKVTEEAVRRVQDNQKKAKQVQQQIQDDKQNNAKFAHFLTFLIQTVKNDTLINDMYETFFKTKHPKTDITYLRKNINTIVRVFSHHFIPQKSILLDWKDILKKYIVSSEYLQ